LGYSLSYQKLEQQVFQLFSSELRNKKLLVAVSGGLDSVLLFHLLKTLRRKTNFQMIVAHVYHGPERGSYRREAFDFVRQLAGEDVAFVSNVKDPGGSSSEQWDIFGEAFPKNDEESLRVYRSTVLRKLSQLTEADLIVLGHHRDDLLETRLIRLIRGVGPEGLKSMSMKTLKIFRPLLMVWREDLKRLADAQKLRYLEDPSNINLKYLRNWIRHKWLSDLESYRPGATRSLARSLELLSRESRVYLRQLKTFIQPDGVDRSAILALTNVEQRQIIASYLKSRNVKNYSASHVDEVLKRLKSSKNIFEFKVAGRVWNVTATRVRVEDS